MDAGRGCGTVGCCRTLFVRVSRPKGGHMGGFRVSSEVGVGVRTVYVSC